MKKSYWMALVFTELYSIARLFAGMSGRLLYLYPINAIFNLSGYHITTMGKRMVSILVLLLFAALHCYIEDKFRDAPVRGMTEQIEEWANHLGLD